MIFDNFFQLEEYVRQIKDETLKLTLPFGIGVHHAGLAASERVFVEHVSPRRVLSQSLNPKTKY